jgi:hypothetical protein
MVSWNFDRRGGDRMIKNRPKQKSNPKNPGNFQKGGKIPGKYHVSLCKTAPIRPPRTWSWHGATPATRIAGRAQIGHDRHLIEVSERSIPCDFAIVRGLAHGDKQLCSDRSLPTFKTKIVGSHATRIVHFDQRITAFLPRRERFVRQPETCRSTDHHVRYC